MRIINLKLFGLMLALAVAIPVGAMAQTAGAPASAPQVAQPPGGGVDWSGVGIGAATVAATSCTFQPKSSMRCWAVSPAARAGR